MCGIVGYIDFSGKPIEKDTFDRMTDILAHRGPDDKGVEIFQGVPFVGLGHRRLAIIDLSPAAHQPMSNEDGTIWITYNGEIYNYKEIGSWLMAHGHRFKSNSDTEVIVHAYEEWGIECLEKFNGMFSFGIWDKTNNTFWAARDRLGIKSFYYAQTHDGLVFASEIKAIFASGLIKKEPDLYALYTPTRFQISPYTGFKNIYKLPPDHILTFKDDRLAIKRYWDIIPSEEIRNENQAVAELDALLNDSIALQMISDVPIGAFLSGGLDSSLITSLMASQTDSPISTFTIKFSDKDQRFEQMPRDNEFAWQVSRLLMTDHHEYEIEPDVVNLLPKMIYHMEEPLADPAAINTYLIAKSAREKGIKVLLNGMGGDEIFGGYRKHLACLNADIYRNYLPKFVRESIEYLSKMIPTATSKRAFKSIRWGKRFLSFASKAQLERYLMSDLSLGMEDFERLYQSDLEYDQTHFFKTHKELFDNNGCSYLTKMCLNDTKIFLPEHNLTYSDKACMAAGVESRPPFTDHRIVEFMFKVAPALRIKVLTQKYLLKKVGKRYLPKEIVYRPKAPFGVPLRSWIRGGLSEMVADYLSHASLKRRGFYNPRYVTKIVQDDKEGKADNAHVIWQLLTTELWFRTFFDERL